MAENDIAFVQLSNTDWRDIIFRIKKGESVLVIGPGAITNQAGISLYSVLCQNIQNELAVKDDFLNDRLFFLAEKLKQQKAGESILIENAEKVFKVNTTNEILKMISQLPFHMIISTTPDTMLRNAFDQNSIPYNFKFYNYCSSPGKVDKPTREMPLLYHLFGSIEEDDSLILTHDHLFEFIFAILGSKQLPIEIKDELRQSKNFIFLGFDFQEWYLKIILRLFELHNEKSGYAYPWKAMEKETVSFFSSEFQLDFINGNIPEFVKELFDRCTKEGILRQKSAAQPITEKIKNLIMKNEISEAIDMLDTFLSEKDNELLNQVYILSGRYNRLISKVRKGTITKEEASVEENQINTALLDIVSESEKL
jgi:hypothetical protein